MLRTGVEMDEYPELAELISFFGVVPTYRFDNADRPYTDAVCSPQRDGRTLRATINAPTGDLDVVWGEPGQSGLSFELRQVPCFPP